jgi:hypothetical protein
MKRLFALAVCALALTAATASCGGADYDYTDKLTIVGSGS